MPAHFDIAGGTQMIVLSPIGTRVQPLARSCTTISGVSSPIGVAMTFVPPVGARGGRPPATADEDGRENAALDSIAVMSGSISAGKPASTDPPIAAQRCVHIVELYRYASTVPTAAIAQLL